jgi:hypothetical protein
MVAHPAGALHFLAKASADRLNKKTPQHRPAASRTTQKPFLLRAMK